MKAEEAGCPERSDSFTCNFGGLLQEYMETFVQSGPRYGLKHPGWEWRSNAGRISRDLVLGHLEGRFSLASLGRWYPEHGVIDLDGFPRPEAEAIRASLSMDPSNSMLCASERDDHYHLLYRPTFRNAPPTIGLLQSIMAPVSRHFGFEAYPQKYRCLRLPFGPKQRCLDEGKELLDWQGLFYQFKKLEEYNLESVPPAASLADMKRNFPGSGKVGRLEDSSFYRGELLFKHGLTEAASRNHSQFLVLYYLWRLGTDYDEAIALTKHWIRKRHNDFSVTALSGSWRTIDREIERQSRAIWETYKNNQSIQDQCVTFPDGWVARGDLIPILVACQGDLRLSRFLYKLLKFCYPRIHQGYFIPIHTRRLEGFCSEQSYLDYLDRLNEIGVIDRRSGYRVGVEAKKIHVNWYFNQSADPLLIDGRSPETLDTALLISFPKEELVYQLRKKSMDTRSISSIMRSLAKRGHPIKGTLD